jgi:uncharacterized SAM-binding protein YcdF (DUF218 family)
LRSGEKGGIFFRLLSLLVFAAFLAILFLIRHPLMRLAGQLWLVNESPVKSDAIIVLGDDNYDGDRAFQAASLFRAGMAPVVVASGRALRPYAGLAEIIGHDLESHGVPSAAVVKFSHRGNNTREEAEALAGLVASRGWKSVLVVTSDYHVRRARFIFEHVFPAAVTVHMSSARDSEFDASRWWETRTGIKIFAGELLGYVVAAWELRRNLDASEILGVSTIPCFVSNRSNSQPIIRYPRI